MGKQDIVQVLLVDSSVKVVFLEEGANALDLIHLVLQEIKGDESLEMDTTSWKVILISMEDNDSCLEVLSKQDSNELIGEEEIVNGNTRYLQNQEKIFPILEKVKLQAVKAEGLSSQSVQDIHDLSQYLHKPCFKIVDTKLTIKLQIQKGTDNQDIIDMEFYIDEHMSFNNLIKIVDESLSARGEEINLELTREISLIKINSEENKETIIVNLEDTIYNLMTNLNLDIENNIILDYKFHYGLPENWYTKMGSMTSKLTKNLARPLSVYTFFGGNNNLEKKTAEATRHENLIKRRIASPSRMVRHMSLSGKDSETGIDLSTITTWISGDVGKLRRQTDLDNNNSMDWANTYPITRGLKQRERLPTTEESEIQSEIQEDINQEQSELEDELNELDKAFLEVLDELNIKDAIREKMMEFPASKKLELIEQNEMVRKMKSPNSATSPPQPMSMTRPNSIVSINTINSSSNDNPSSAAQASLESILTTERPTITTTPATSGISNFIFGSLFSNNSNCVPGSTDYYLKFLSSKNLSSNETFKLLQSLRIHLSTAAVTWVRSFLEDGTALLGIETLLMKYIEKNISIVDQSNIIKIQDIDEDIHLECIRCLRVLLNTESGFHEVLKHPEIVKYLTFSINTQNDKIRKISTEVLAAICVLSKQGHMQILDSLADFRLKFHEDYRFQYLLHSLEAHVSLEGISAIAAYEYKTTCLSFINALVNTPESLDERMLLREEFHRRGLKVVFQELRESYPPESLVKQIECYEEELEADKNELKEQILIQTLDDDKNHPLLKLSNNIKQLSGESVLRTIINEIISHLSNLLNNEYQDELRYEICNLIDMFCHHMLNLKDIEDYNSSLLPFFEEAKEFVGLNIRDVLELSEEFQLEMQEYKRYEQELKDTKEKLENSELELKELKDIAIINYFIEQKNKGSEDIDFSKSPKDNFTTLVQKLIQKEKEISKLNERIDRLANIKGSNSLLESSKLPEFSRSAIKDELDLQKQQNKELTSNLDSKQKEIAYLKRSLEAVCAKFQLKINEYVPENNNNNLNDIKNNSMEINNGITDLLSVTDVQILQAELEEAREKLAVKEDSENKINELQASISRLELQVNEQNNKLKEKEIEIENWEKNNNILEESNINDNTLIPTKTIPLPPPPPPLPQFTNTSQSKLNNNNSNIIPVNIPPPPPLPPNNNNNNKIPPPPLLSPPIFNKSTGSLPPPPPPLPLISNHKVTKSTLLPPPPPPPMSSILQKLTQDNTTILPIGIPPPPPPNGTGGNLLAISSQSQKNVAIKPKVPMKALFWKKIGNGRVRDTIWENMELDKIYKKMDFEEIELLFCKKITKKPGSGYSSIGRKLKGKKSITLLDFNRANNIAIALARMKMPFPAIRLAILEINDTRLSIDNLRSLENIAPTQDEIKIVKSYNGTLETLGTAEKYILQILDIPRLSERLNCMIFRRKFDSDLQDIKPELTTLNQVIIELKTSKRLAILLEIILSLGNYLNANTPRGEAKGFKLEALRLLKDVKANTTTSNRPITSFLHYICQMLEDHWKDILKLKEDFKTIEAAARISVTTLSNNIYSLTQGVKRIEAEIQQHKKLILKPENDRFIEVMEKFIASGSSISKSIKENGEKLESNLEELLTYFGEDSSSTKPEDFFNLIISFLDALELAHNENVKLRAKKVNKLVNHQVKISNQDIKSIGFGQGDFDVAIRELRSGLRRKRGDRPKSNLFNLPGFGKIPPMDTNESTTTNTITN